MKVLVIQQRYGIGDMVIFSPYIQAISKKCGVPVSILAKKSSKASEIFSEDNSVNEIIDLDSIIFLIGLQELGQFQKRFNKQKKLEVIHIAVCKLLSDYGYYEFDHTDNDGWPHYKLIKKLPNLKAGEQTILMKKAIINYFVKSNYIN